MGIRFLALLFLFNFSAYAQERSILELTEDQIIDLGSVEANDENFQGFDQLKVLLDGVEIVMLGEQSHGEGTAYLTKTKLIKYLHREMGFDILAFESGIYDCRKAWEAIENGMDAQEAMAKSIVYLWSLTEEFAPLADYIEEQVGTTRELRIEGFDGRFMDSFTKEGLIADLEQFVASMDSALVASAEWKHLVEAIELYIPYDRKALKKRATEQDTLCLDRLISRLDSTIKTEEAEFWNQVMRNLKSALISAAFDRDLRDAQMAENLLWLKAQNPDSKIICWGATSHFLYRSEEVHMRGLIVRMLGGNYYKDQRMMGDYVKAHFGEKLYTIGFTAYEGQYGLNREAKIKPAKEGTFEYELAKLKADNFLLPFTAIDTIPLPSRPLGNYYMTNDISRVMDAVIFNRTMSRPAFNKDLIDQLYPKKAENTEEEDGAER
jgi:erythromycin esterase